MIEGISKERERLKVALDSEPCDVFTSTSNNQSSISLKDESVSKILQQNLDLKTRLLKIHEASNLEEAAGLDQLKEKVSAAWMVVFHACEPGFVISGPALQ